MFSFECVEGNSNHEHFQLKLTLLSLSFFVNAFAEMVGKWRTGVMKDVMGMPIV